MAFHDHRESLHGKTVVVACSEQKIARLKTGLEQMGARVLHFPAIEIRALQDTRPLDQALDSLQSYRWIVFTSAYAVRFFMERLKNRFSGSPSMPDICAVGPATAEAVSGFGHRAALVPETFVAEGVVEALRIRHGGLQSLAGQRILIPRAKEAREIIPERLASAGALVDIVPCYENVRPGPDESLIRELRSSPPDLLVFTSSSALRNMIDNIGYEDGKSMLLKSVVAVLGPVTGSTAESFGKRAEIVPKESTVASLLEEIGGYYGSPHSTADRR